MNVAVIPARGGSKRIPKKNIRQFCGKPLIAWPIQAAQESDCFEHVIVSTDDEEIAEVSEKYDAIVPFVRPANLSDDYASTNAVMAHAVSWMQRQSWNPEAVCCIYATSVFLTVEDLLNGFSALSTGNWAYAFSVTDFEYPIFRSFKEHSDGGIEMFCPDQFGERSQDLPVALHDAAQFYWGKPKAWLESAAIYERHSCPVKIPRWRIQDIDSEDDWKRAELMFEAINKQR